MIASAAKCWIGFSGIAGALVMVAGAPTLAQEHGDYGHGDHGHGGYRPPPPHWHRPPQSYYEHPNSNGAVVGGVLAGIGVGAVIGALAAPPPVVYAPPPPYYPPPPPMYYGY